MSKKKQAKPNGFSIFMREMQEELRAQGKNVSMKNMPTLAGPKWAQLSDARKQAYQAVAKRQWSGGATAGNPDLRPPVVGQGIPRPGKMDSTGMLLSERRDFSAELAERRSKEKEQLRASLSPGKDAALDKFHFIDFQSLCDISMKGQTHYLPCEVAMVEFSLCHGVTRKFHKFIDPGKIPMGYRFMAQSTSETTHQIPISDFELAEKNYRELLGSMEEFLDPNWTEKMPILFSKREQALMSEWCLNWLADKAGVMNRLTKVYEVDALFCALSGHLDGKPMSQFRADELLKTSVYDYETGTRCDFHEEKETKYCSLGVCNIYTFILSESLCPPYGVSITSAHLPKVTAMGVVTTVKHKAPSEKVAQGSSDEEEEFEEEKLAELRMFGFEEEATAVPVIARGRGRGIGRGLTKFRQVGGLHS